MLFRQHQRVAKQSTSMLVVLFAALILGMVVVTNAALAVAWIISTAGSTNFPKLFFVVNTGVVLLYVFGSYAIEAWHLSDGGAYLALQAGGVEITEPQNIYEKRLCNVVMEVAIAAGIRPPRIFVLRSEEAINAFAAGWDIQDAIIAVTQGSIERLSRDELQGVVAHEFSHIVHGDIRLNMTLMGMVLGLQMVYNLGRAVVASLRDGIGWIRAVLVLTVGSALMLVGWLGWLAGRILYASVSRQREFLADASAVKYTRLTKGLAGALQKIAFQQQTERDQIQRKQAQALAPLFLHFSLNSRWFATHPPIVERLKRLGVSYAQRKELPADDVQKFSADEFFSARLVPDAAVTPALRDVPVQWAEDLPYVENVLKYDLPDTPLPEIEWPGNTPIQQFVAEERLQNGRILLSKALPVESLMGALLAFWVIEGGEKQQKIWEDLCRNNKGRVQTLMLESVLSLNLKVREPIFEGLITQMEGWPREQHQQLVERALVLLRSYAYAVPRGWLRLAVTRYWLRENKKRQSIIYHSFEQVKDAVAVLSTLLAKCLEIPDEAQWMKKVYSRLKLTDMPEVNMDADQLRTAVLKMHRLALMVMPTLIKVWMHEWEAVATDRNPIQLQRDADTFRLMCDLLDTPRPPRLIAWHETPSMY